MRAALCLDPAAWDAFVISQPNAVNYHSWKWQTPIEETFGHQPYYLAATQEGAIRGVLPLFAIRSRIFGKSLVSVPFFSYGGVLAAEPEARSALLTEAAKIATEIGARHVELRQGVKTEWSWAEASAKVAMEVDLPVLADDLWKQLGSRLRNKIRHAEKHGFAVEFRGAEGIGDFYPVFATNMRNLGTPVYPRSWFEGVCRQAPDAIRIVLLREGGKPVAGAFLSGFRDLMEAPWIASLPDGRKNYSSALLYWSFLRFAVEKGFRRFDLGRCTPGGGTHTFKKLWGCRERRLHWYYWLAPGSEVPNLRPDNAKFDLAIQMWKHLPLFVANQLGPRIVRSLP